MRHERWQSLNCWLVRFQFSHREAVVHILLLSPAQDIVVNFTKKAIGVTAHIEVEVVFQVVVDVKAEELTHVPVSISFW